MDRILAKAEELAARKEQIDAEKKVAKLEKDYKDIELQLKSVLGDDAQEIIEQGKPYFTKNRDKVYLQSGDWLFDEGGWHEKPQCTVTHVNLKNEGYSYNWQYFSDLATFGAAIKHQLGEIERQATIAKDQAERAEAYYNANPDQYAISLFKRLVVDIDAWDGERRHHLNTGQRLMIALAYYLADRNELPDFEEPEPDDNESENDDE